MTEPLKGRKMTLRELLEKIAEDEGFSPEELAAQRGVSRDDTGARRFWPIRCTDINLDYIRQNRNQLFAEAIYRLKAGEDWHTMPNTETKAEQRERYTDDPWTAPTMEYLVGKNDVTTQEILDDAVKLPTNRQQRPDVSRIVAILRMAGWIKGAQQRRNGVVRNIWVRPVDKPES